MPFADVVIIGSGIAALSAAEKLCQTKNVIIITKKKLRNNNSNLAQGGVAVAIADDDHWQKHYTDTLIAGCFHNDETAVQLLVGTGPKEVQRLIQQGMQFDYDGNGKLSLGQEGAHRERRILHAGGDATGANLMDHLLKRVQDKVTFVEDEMVLDFIIQNGRCLGVITRDKEQVTKAYYAPHTILAAGGIGALYTYTSNDSTITGDGIAMMYRAGGILTDLEFVQFHPTMLYVNGRCCGLVSEAVRGEGAVLLNSKQEKFMERVHEQKDLAPRDVVARAIHEQILLEEKVYLDISMIPHFSERFPTISALCEENGIQIDSGLIPVMPGVHFHMGGVKTNLQGDTGIHGLYAVGEVACNGVHGANRLASNSLLEGLVFGSRVGEHILSQEVEGITESISGESTAGCSILLPQKEHIQDIMMKYVGIVRSEQQLLYAKQWLEQYMVQLDGFGTLPSDSLTSEQIVIVNMLTTAWLITSAALQRKESIGGHYRIDYPLRAEGRNRTELSKKTMILQLV
ncbi:L-aspartate oxidase [Bacillus sp. 165]|uniref:L-aspartate oxidase n=1 Tax=Bacillus sp. 165 TaxID=1529117 RepID=UPI001AD9FA55|nr:L-aspartate oxidase [Bacillus sp. 165]MBO9130491.1 L-aspartate oxidase [Bacillus sp. 165]